MGKRKMRCVKSFYWSDLGAEPLRLNPQRQLAYKYAKEIGGVVRSRKFPEDEGTEYRVYIKREDK